MNTINIWLIAFIILFMVLFIFLLIIILTRKHTNKDQYLPPSCKDVLVLNIKPKYIDYSKLEKSPLIFLMIKIYCDVLDKSIGNTTVYAITKDNTMIPFKLYYNGLKPNDYKGQIFGNDNDQYANYFFTLLVNPVQFSNIIVYPANHVNYINFIIGDYRKLYILDNISGNSDRCEYIFNEKVVPNPFTNNHKTTNCYPIIQNNSPVQYFKFSNLPSIQDSGEILPGFYRHSDGKIGVYRVDKKTSMESFITEEKKTSCFDNYLFTAVQYRKTSEYSETNFVPYGIIRIPPMKVYTTSDDCGTWTNDYIASYYSVTFHVTDEILDPPMLPFWTINMRMLKEIADKDGYSYIFWAPHADVVKQMKSPSQNTPPIIQWGNRKGALFHIPTGRIIYRYKQLKHDWAGSPGNAICYPTYEQNKPITTQLIDPKTGIDYCPSVYGGFFDNFNDFMNSPFIGSVQKNGQWPSSV